MVFNDSPHRMELLREYWYGWKYFTQAEKENIIDTSSYKELVCKMHEKGGLSAEKLLGRSSIFWDDMNFKKDNIFFKFQYTKLPAEYHDFASLIVKVLNKLKEASWAFTFCVKDVPGYDSHPMRKKILAAISQDITYNASNADLNLYDEVVSHMRKIIQTKIESYEPPLTQSPKKRMSKPEEESLYKLEHLTKVNARLMEREEWFKQRIEQLETYCRKIGTGMGELKKQCTMTEKALKEMKEKYEPPESPKAVSPLDLRVCVDLNESARKLRESVLEEEGSVGGMTPSVPLLPIPTHSLKKTISWSGDIEKLAGKN